MLRDLLTRALEEWAGGRYYEAHEILEDAAELFDEEDPSFDVALALTRSAACLHKLKNDVGVRAVPGKLEAALATLRDAPADWGGLDMAALVAELEVVAAKIAGGTVPPDLRYPVPRWR